MTITWIVTDYLTSNKELSSNQLYDLICNNHKDLTISSKKNFQQLVSAVKIKMHIRPKRKDIVSKSVNESSKFENKLTIDQTSNTMFVEASRITSLEELIKQCNIDLNIWDIDRHVVNKWEVGAKDANDILQVTPLFQIKCWLKKKAAEVLDLIDLKKTLVEDLKKGDYYKTYSPLMFVKNISKNDSACLMTMNLMDLHLGKMAHGEETGENYDFKIAQSRFFTAIDDLIQKSSGQKIDRILFPVGNDFYNTDTDIPFSMTTAGTPQQNDLRWQQLFRTGHKMISTAINTLSQIAPVDVVMVAGNHDTARNYYLGEVLDVAYHGSDRVNINNSPKMRKYYQYHQNLFGLTHGDKEKIAELFSLMANEAKDLWAETSFREFLLGHIHHKKEISYKSTEDYNGMVIRYMRSLSANDAWHTARGYCGAVKGAEAFIYSKDSGLISYVNHNLKQ